MKFCKAQTLRWKGEPFNLAWEEVTLSEELLGVYEGRDVWKNRNRKAVLYKYKSGRMQTDLISCLQICDLLERQLLTTLALASWEERTVLIGKGRFGVSTV